jgi:hypothetical protein
MFFVALVVVFVVALVLSAGVARENRVDATFRAVVVTLGAAFWMHVVLTGDGWVAAIIYVALVPVLHHAFDWVRAEVIWARGGKARAMGLED